MVFFTCNNCGDSLKKKDCANHAGKCRPLALTCVDCHKDFYGDQYVAHTSCITEAEKYGAKGFVSRTPSTAGVAKQEEWMHAVHIASETQGLTNNQRSFLGTLTRHGNVPKKKKQFQNFARNVWKDSYRQPAVVEQVFEIIELESKKIKGSPTENVTTTSKAEGTQENGDPAEKSSVELMPEESSVDSVVNDLPSKKSKKHKRKKEEEIDELIVNGDEAPERTGVALTEDPSSNRKKKNKNRPENGVEEMKENGTGTVVSLDNIEEVTTSKKSKKNKHKRQEPNVIEEVTENGNGTEESASSKKKKEKKKKKKQLEEETLVPENNENGIVKLAVETVEDQASMKKSKKKGHKKHVEEGVEQPTENENGLAEIEFEVGKDIGKKSKKKKHKHQDDKEEVPRKKSKLASA